VSYSLRRFEVVGGDEERVHVLVGGRVAEREKRPRCSATSLAVDGAHGPAVPETPTVSVDPAAQIGAAASMCSAFVMTIGDGPPAGKSVPTTDGLTVTVPGGSGQLGADEVALVIVSVSRCPGVAVEFVTSVDKSNPANVSVCLSSRTSPMLPSASGGRSSSSPV